MRHKEGVPDVPLCVSPFFIVPSCHLQHVLEELPPVTVSLQRFVDVKIQDAERLRFVVGTVTVLRRGTKWPRRGQDGHGGDKMAGEGTRWLSGGGLRRLGVPSAPPKLTRRKSFL